MAKQTKATRAAEGTGSIAPNAPANEPTTNAPQTDTPTEGRILPDLSQGSTDNAGNGSTAPNVPTAPEGDEPTAKKIITLSDAEAIEAIKAAMGGSIRNIHDDFATGLAAYQKAAELATKHGLPSAGYLTEDWYPLGEGETVSVEETAQSGETVTKEITVYPNRMRVAVAAVGAQVPGKEGKKIVGLRGVVMFPIPSGNAFVDHPRGIDWLTKIAEKEAALVAFRSIRYSETDEDFAANIADMPKTVDDYVTRSSQQSDATLAAATEMVATVWKQFKAVIAKKQKAFAEALPNRDVMMKAFRSRDFALQHADLGKLERNNTLTVLAIRLAEVAKGWKDAKGNPTPLDTTAFETIWDRRNEVPYEAKDTSALDMTADQLDF